MGMKDIIGIESFRIGDVTYTDADLQSLPIPRLEEMKLKINSDVLAISAQIKSKQADHSAGGGGASAEWFINANHALSLNQRFMPYLASIIKQRKQVGRSLDSYFVDVARDVLDAKDFQYILGEAQARKEANNR